MRRNKRTENKRQQEMMEGRESQRVSVDLIHFLLGNTRQQCGLLAGKENVSLIIHFLISLYLL